MIPLSYTIVGDEDGANIVVFVPGFPPAVAHSSHRNFDAIVSGAKDGDASVLGLFDVADSLAAEFESLSDRVSAANGRLYFDGDEVVSAIAETILRAKDEGSEYLPFVRFLENVQDNPNEHSRTMLYDWLSADQFSITADGNIVGYKGCQYDADGNIVSVNRGRAIVDDVVYSGNIPNGLGSTVRMPRSEVQHDPADGCSTGLHVGTFGYANDWSRGVVLEVHVNPRDVVSVPTDCGAQKLRTCAYYVSGILETRYDSAVIIPQNDGGDSWTDGE